MAAFRKILRAAAAAALLAVPSARAWSLFGSGDKAGEVLRAADRRMERADAEFAKGEYERARDFFSQALDGYMQVEALAPDYKDGLPALRIRYCASRMTNAVAAMVAAPAGEADPETAADADGASADPGTADGASAGPSEAPAEAPAVPARHAPGTAEAPAVEARPSASPVGAPAVEARHAPVPAGARNYIHDFNEARSLIEEGFLSEAADILVPLLRQDPGNRSIRLMIAIVRTRQGRFDEAIGALEDLRGRREDLPILLAISGAYLGAGRYPDALLALDRAVKLAPGDPAAYLDLAWLSLVMPGAGRDAIPNAEAYYREAIKRGAARDRALEQRIGLVKW